MSMRRRTLTLATLAVALSATAVVSALPPAGASPAPSPTPAATPATVKPMITRAGGLEPNQVAAAVPTLEHIVKDTSDSPSCTGYRSQTTPPNTIRVFLTKTNQIVTVGFQTYVEDVLPNEWIPTWNLEALKAGAVAVKSYAWFWVNHYGGYYGTSPTSSNCFDVDDSTNFQVYNPAFQQDATNTAVQQTWPIFARDADTHEVRQTFFRADLANHTTGHDTCGQGANGTTLSQWGSQACAVTGTTATGPQNYQQILRTYYFAVAANQIPPMELATATLGPVSAPRPGPVVLSSLNTLVAYRQSNHDILASSQPGPLRAFGPWSTIDRGPVFIGQPVAVKTANNTLAVFAHTGTSIDANGQQSVGASFTGWVPIGAASPTVPAVSSDPEVLTAPSGALVVYVTAADGNVWGIGQTAANGSWGVWQQLTTSGGYSGKPAALVTVAGLIVIYARNGGVIQGSGQSRRGGVFSAWTTMGTGAAAITATGDPSVFQAGDGTLSVVVGGAAGNGSPIWMVSQPAPRVAYGAWNQVSTSTSFTSAVVTQPISSTGPIVFYADNGGFVQGAQAATPASAFSTFGNMGTGSPQAAGDPSMLFASNGAIVIYVIGADGYLWGAGQSARGTIFGGWSHIGT